MVDNRQMIDDFEAQRILRDLERSDKRQRDIQARSSKVLGQNNETLRTTKRTIEKCDSLIAHFDDALQNIVVEDEEEQKQMTEEELYAQRVLGAMDAHDQKYKGLGQKVSNLHQRARELPRLVTEMQVQNQDYTVRLENVANKIVTECYAPSSDLC